MLVKSSHLLLTEAIQTTAVALSALSRPFERMRMSDERFYSNKLMPQWIDAAGFVNCSVQQKQSFRVTPSYSINEAIELHPTAA